MNSQFIAFVQLVSPFIVGTILIGLQFCLRGPVAGTTRGSFSFFGLVTIEREFQNIVYLRLLLILLSTICFIIPIFRDYSGFFPDHFQMEAFFDDVGLEKALGDFTKQELSDLRMTKDWKPAKKHYLEKINKEAQKWSGNSLRFDGPRGTVYSTGQLLFEAKKIKGLQKYTIERAHGTLSHVFDTPGQKRQTLASEFQLIETDANYIEASVADIYLRFTKIICPEFKQIIRLSPSEEVYLHRLIAVTKLQFFPIVNISKTIYLWQDPTTRETVPIGYAIYTPY